MPRLVVTPWADPAELLAVREQLYDPEARSRRAAVDLVRTWRRRGAIPHALESTALLVDAELHHLSFINGGETANGDAGHHGSGDAAGVSSAAAANGFPVCAVYSTAFARFVTGFCDTAQSGVAKRSMMTMADEYGLPVRFIEMRHQITHGRLPPLRSLHGATQDALRWLYAFYWATLDPATPAAPDASGHVLHLGRARAGGGGAAAVPALTRPGGVRVSRSVGTAITGFTAGGATAVFSALIGSVSAEHTALRDELRAVLKGFTSTRVAELKRRVKKPAAVDDVAQRCSALCTEHEDAQVLLVTVLADKKMLVPSDKQIGSSMDGAFLLWDELLVRLSNDMPRFLRLLVLRLVDLMTAPSPLETETDPFKEAAYFWLRHICMDPKWTSDALNSVQKRHVAVLQSCFETPTFWSQRLAQDVIDAAAPGVKADWEPVLQACIAEDDSVATDDSSANDQDVRMEDPSEPDAGTADAAAKDSQRSDTRESLSPGKPAETASRHIQRQARGWRQLSGHWTPTPIGVCP